VAAFGRETAGASLVTYMVDADTRLDAHPLLRNAVTYWRSGIPTRKPICISCKRSFGEVEPGAFLLATQAVPSPTSASVSAICVDCWSTLDDNEVHAVALRTLARVLPGARFANHRDASP